MSRNHLKIYRQCVREIMLVEKQLKETKYLLQPEYHESLLRKYAVLLNLKRQMKQRLERRIEKSSPNLLTEIIDVPSDSELKPIAEIIDVE